MSMSHKKNYPNEPNREHASMFYILQSHTLFTNSQVHKPMLSNATSWQFLYSTVLSDSHYSIEPSMARSKSFTSQMLPVKIKQSSQILIYQHTRVMKDISFLHGGNQCRKHPLMILNLQVWAQISRQLANCINSWPPYTHMWMFKGVQNHRHHLLQFFYHYLQQK